MLKTEEKKKQEYSYKISEEYVDEVEREVRYSLSRLNSEKKLDRIIFIKAKANDECCGSIEILQGQFAGLEFQIRNIFPKEERQKLLNELISNNDVDFENRNHVYFLDRTNGIIEQLFGDLEFKVIDTFLNKNSENTVNMWSYHKWTTEEVEEMINDDYDEDDDW